MWKDELKRTQHFIQFIILKYYETNCKLKIC